MNIELTIREAKELASLFNAAAQSDAPGPWQIGKSYLVRTETMYITGELVEVYPLELLFSGAEWVFDTGNFGKALETWVFEETEPFPGPVIVGRLKVIDAAVRS